MEKEVQCTKGFLSLLSVALTSTCFHTTLTLFEAEFIVFLLLQSVQTATRHYSYTATLLTQRYTLRQVSHPHTLLTVDVGAGTLEDVVPAAAVGCVQASRTVHEGPLGDGHGVGDNGRRDVLLGRDARVVGLGQAGGVLTCH